MATESFMYDPQGTGAGHQCAVQIGSYVQLTEVSGEKLEVLKDVIQSEEYLPKPTARSDSY